MALLTKQLYGEVATVTTYKWKVFLLFHRGDEIEIFFAFLDELDYFKPKIKKF